MSGSDGGYTGNEIAIVGLSCRFPGAKDANELWANLRAGRESIVRYDDATLLAAGVEPSLLANPNYVKAGGQLPELEGFDAAFFGFGPKDAAITDPQHRHMLECAWEALEDAGHPPARFDGAIGVFVGCGMNGYFIYNLLRNPDILASTGAFLLRHTGNDRDFLPTTVSYKLNLTGPSLAIQTACSTSLVAIHVACQSLLASECDLALAGGVTIVIPPGQGYMYNENEPLSPDGHCRAFDAKGAGTVLTSGIGVVALRRLADALADGDPIHAVIRGSAINNDGSRKIGYLAPSVDGQAAVIAEALAIADVSADEISYVETHGTGTNVGDPIEISALTQAFRQTSERNGYCAIGSNKPNLGHTDTAAGVASLIKVVKALQHGELPPSLHYERANPTIDFAHSPFFVNHELGEWKRANGKRRAGVSSLGVGGTNAHVIVEEAPERRGGPAQRPFEILPLSAKSAGALDAAAARLAEFLRANPSLALADVAHTLQVGRDAFEHRRVLVARGHDEAADLLARSDTKRVFGARSKGSAPSVVFMFPGGGAQYPNMGHGLYQSEPVYRAAMDEAFAAARGLLDFDLRALIYPGANVTPEGAAKLARPTACLPAIFATEIALAKLWLSWGIEPAALTGHSMGEYTAACLAGVISLVDGLRIVATRGRLVDSLTTSGRMLSVPLPEAQLRALLPADLDLGVVNGPSLCVVCGETAAIERFDAELHARDVACQQLRVPAAGHCRLLDPILEEFHRCLRSVSFSAPRIPYISNLTGTWVLPEDAQDPAYWLRHFREPVKFSQGLGALLEDPNRVLLEVGPGQTLASLARQQSKPARAAFGSLRHPDDSVPDEIFVATSFGRLWTSGVDVDWSARRGDEARLRVALPTYAWEHQRYWIDGLKTAAVASPADTELVRREAVASWFTERVFRPEALDAKPAGEPLSWLVFADPSGLGASLSAELERLGHTVTVVREGDAFYRLSEREYALAPEAGVDGYVELVRDLDANGRLPDRIAHLWLVTADESARPGSNFFHRNQERGFFSLLHLAQALGGEDVKQTMHVTVVSNGMQRVGDERLRYPEKATVLGPVGVIPQELPQLTLQSIDLEPPELARGGRKRGARAPGVELVAQLVADMTPAHADRRVAYRAGQRFVERLEAVPPSESVPASSALRERGTYLVTGGLGGLGLLLAEHLARSVRARLVLVARSRIPNRSEWQSWLASHGSTDATSQKLRKLVELEALGAELLIESGDVADIVRMREIVAHANERFGEIHGVFHVAGAIDDAPIQTKTQGQIEAVFSPKVHGTLVLDELLPDVELFALFSSSSSALGAAGQIDYAAASAFLDAFAQSRSDRARPRTLAIGWGVWRDVGLAVQSYERLGSGGASGRPASHPLLGRRISDAADRTTFSTTFKGPEHWLLDDHRTRAGDALIPGTGYLEIVRAAFAELDSAASVELRDVFFSAPCLVGAGEDVELRTLVRRAGDACEIEIESRVAGDSEWQLHAQAEAGACKTPAPAPLPLAQLRERMGAAKTAGAGESLDTLHARHLRFGPRWSVLRTMRFSADEALAELELPEAFAGDLGGYALHPALLDLATGFATPLIEGYTGAQLYAPMSYKRVRVHAPLPRRISSFVRSAQPNQVEKEVALFDVTIADESGRVIVEVEQFAIRKLAADAVLTRAPVRTKAAAGRGADAHAESGHLTAAERVFRRSYELGIKPAEGMEALDRLLGGPPRAHVFVSSLDLPQLVERIRSAPRADAGPKTAFARPELETHYVAPRDEIERLLSGFWQELLGVDKVGIRDDFFELGGHSLIAVRLFAKIKKAWDVEYAISVLFEAPNIEKCAALVREDLGIELGGAQPEVRRKERRSRFLVPLQTGTASRPPFFLVAGMFGNVLNLRHLAQHLGSDQTVYAIQAKGLLGDDEPHRRFPDMARDYLEEVRAVQPDGPYYIGGFSGGGITALEMAMQLLAQEQEIGILVLLDSLPAENVPLGAARRLRIHAQRMAREGLSYPLAWLRNRIRWEFEKRAARRAPPVRDLSPAEFRSGEIEKAFLEALAHYRTPVYPGKALLLRPRHDDWLSLGGGLLMNPHNRGQIANHENRFAPHVLGGVEVHEVSGDHDAMVLEPHVRNLSAKLRACLDEAIQAKAGPCRS
ncbi:MAG: beta-ketoacyl synthase N-terminal-like domain-containing protein [Myxococcota bacterium]